VSRDRQLPGVRRPVAGRPRRAGDSQPSRALRGGVRDGPRDSREPRRPGEDRVGCQRHLRGTRDDRCDRVNGALVPARRRRAARRSGRVVLRDVRRFLLPRSARRRRWSDGRGRGRGSGPRATRATRAPSSPGGGPTRLRRTRFPGGEHRVDRSASLDARRRDPRRGARRRPARQGARRRLVRPSSERHLLVPAGRAPDRRLPRRPGGTVRRRVSHGRWLLADVGAWGVRCRRRPVQTLKAGGHRSR
jgi:hypothetical protein